jgi:hypothetical protein
VHANGNETPGQLLAGMDKAGVDKIVLFSVHGNLERWLTPGKTDGLA